MAEYFVKFPEEQHTAMINGSYMENQKQEALSEFNVPLPKGDVQILEIISNETMGIVATFALTEENVSLIIDLEKELCYNVPYSVLHYDHIFPTLPPVTIRKIDS